MAKKLHVMFFTFLGIGFFPIGQGTIASLISAIMFYFLNTYLHILVIVILALLFAVFTHKIGEIWREKDPHYVVMDEVVGMGISTLLLPKKAELFLISFAIFRFIDILKIPPVNIFDRIKSPHGILLDDTAAGIMTSITMHILISILYN